MAMIERVIPQERAGDYRRWDLPDVGAPPPPPEPAPAAEEPQQAAGEEAQDPQDGPKPEELERLREAARQEGFEQGHREGYEAGRAEGREAGHREGEARGRRSGERAMRPHIQALEQLLQGLATPYAELDQAMEEELVQLAMAVARHLVRRELRTDPSAVVAVLREALGALPSAERKVRLYLHPQDARVVRDALQVEELNRPWSVVEDPTLSRGGVRVETDTSRVDATLETRLNAVIASVWGGERRGDRDPDPTHNETTGADPSAGQGVDGGPQAQSPSSPGADAGAASVEATEAEEDLWAALLQDADPTAPENASAGEGRHD
ncbi:flagellar assembly protein FliH [Ectothiorhodospira mobilis]|uniref:flagellar assembly protein FliH n=1 Tax=Ectothiorhodospira mobilis TaxID=195064 RepID=UPI001EE8C6F8|nr:flagellar assembly protein FliH [Ectothiorhodospira mobilis]MCG5535059.1 flagellar assembly protein FliH [Ectothiorhodospira mobilis]